MRRVTTNVSYPSELFLIAPTAASHGDRISLLSPLMANEVEEPLNGPFRRGMQLKLDFKNKIVKIGF